MFDSAASSIKVAGHTNYTCNHWSVKLTQDLIPGQTMNISSNFRSKVASNSLHTLLNACNLELCKKLINDLSLLLAIRIKWILVSWQRMNSEQALIPDIDCKPASHPMALKSTADRVCLYNSVSLFLCGDETQSNWLCLLVTEELYSNAEYYSKILPNLPRSWNQFYSQLPWQQLVSQTFTCICYVI